LTPHFLQSASKSMRLRKGMFSLGTHNGLTAQTKKQRGKPSTSTLTARSHGCCRCCCCCCCCRSSGCPSITLKELSSARYTHCVTIGSRPCKPPVSANEQPTLRVNVACSCHLWFYSMCFNVASQLKTCQTEGAQVLYY